MIRRALTAAVIAVATLLAMSAAAHAADTTPPKSTIYSVQNFIGNQLIVGFRVNEEVSGVECRVDSLPFAPCPNGGDWHTSLPYSGFHNVDIRATDLAGNVETDTTHTIYVEPSAPALDGPYVIRHQMWGGWMATTDPTFKIDTQDPRIHSFLCGVDVYNQQAQVTKELEPCGREWSPGPLSQGVHHITVRSIDELGVKSFASSGLEFSIDSWEPVASILAPARTVVGAPFKVKIVARDVNAVSRHCTLDRAPIDCKSRMLEDLPVGVHRLTASVTDVIGREAFARARIRVARR